MAERQSGHVGSLPSRKPKAGNWGRYLKWESESGYQLSSSWVFLFNPIFAEYFEVAIDTHGLKFSSLLWGVSLKITWQHCPIHDFAKSICRMFIYAMYVYLLEIYGLPECTFHLPYSLILLPDLVPIWHSFSHKPIHQPNPTLDTAICEHNLHARPLWLWAASNSDQHHWADSIDCTNLSGQEPNHEISKCWKHLRNIFFKTNWKRKQKMSR